MFGALRGGIQDVLGSAADDLIEHVILFLVIQKFRHLKRRAPVGAAIVDVVNEKRDHAFGVGIGKRVEQHVLDDAEDGGGGADAESERDDGEKRERRLIAKSAQAVLEVAEERNHEELDAEPRSKFPKNRAQSGR